jgi:hypothetical protein
VALKILNEPYGEENFYFYVINLSAVKYLSAITAYV